MLSASPVELKPFAGTDKVKPLGISSKQRSRHMPDVPAIVETVPSSPFVATYNGLMAPKGTPKEIIDALAATIIAAEKTPEFLAKLAKIGVEPGGTTPQEMAAEIAADTERWRAVAEDLTPKGQ